jgi:hypothetical protein
MQATFNFIINNDHIYCSITFSRNGDHINNQDPRLSLFAKFNLASTTLTCDSKYFL